MAADPALAYRRLDELLGHAGEAWADSTPEERLRRLGDTCHAFSRVDPAAATSLHGIDPGQAPARWPEAARAHLRLRRAAEQAAPVLGIDPVAVAEPLWTSAHAGAAGVRST